MFLADLLLFALLTHGQLGSFFELPWGFFCHIWAEGASVYVSSSALALSQEVPLPAQPMDLGQAAQFPVLWIYPLGICFENSLVFCGFFNFKNKMASFHDFSAPCLVGS